MVPTHEDDEELAGRAPPGPSSLPPTVRGGLCGVFVDFDLLHALLSLAGRNGTREEITAAWSAFLRDAGFEASHMDPDELPAGTAPVDRIAADAWRFAERLGWIEAGRLTDDGGRVAAISMRGKATVRDALAPVLATGVEALLQGENGAPIIPLLDQGAHTLAETSNFWARECPGLIPSEVGAIVHWACVNLPRVRHLLDSIVSWRDAAMHAYDAPDPTAPPGTNAALHFDIVSEFYQSHPWLAERVPHSSAEELAMCKLLSYCGLFREISVTPSAFYLAV